MSAVDHQSPEFLAGQEFARTLPPLTAEQRRRVAALLLLARPAPVPEEAS